MAHAAHSHGAPAMRVEDGRLVTGRGGQHIIKPPRPMLATRRVRQGIKPLFDNHTGGSRSAAGAGSVCRMPAVANAVMDALRLLGVKQLDMPMTPARVWRALQSAKNRN